MAVPISLQSLPAGFVIDTRYEVKRRLGGGANGVVYEVADHRTGQVSALKFLLTFDPAAPWAEARVLVGLEGAYILEVRNAHHDHGQPFIVTPVAQHGTVADHIIPGVGVPTETAIRWIQHACRGTSRVHDRRLLHNDIKPDNIFLTVDGEAILGDLGLVGLRDAAGNGAFGGTPATMAPEVAHVGATTPHCDRQQSAHHAFDQSPRSVQLGRWEERPH